MYLLGKDTFIVRGKITKSLARPKKRQKEIKYCFWRARLNNKNINCCMIKWMNNKKMPKRRFIQVLKLLLTNFLHQNKKWEKGWDLQLADWEQILGWYLWGDNSQQHRGRLEKQILWWDGQWNLGRDIYVDCRFSFLYCHSFMKLSGP